MGGADPLDPRHLFQNFGRRVAVIVFGAGDRTGRENAGIEHAAEHHADALLPGQRQELRQRRLLQQRIAAGQQHGVERSGRGETHAHVGLVDADPDAGNDALAAKPVEGDIGAVHRFAKPVLDRIGAMGPDIDVMDQQ